MSGHIPIRHGQLPVRSESIKPEPRDELCSFCCSPGARLRCGGCATTLYCSQPCQRMDSARHRLVCVDFRDAPTQSPRQLQPHPDPRRLNRLPPTQPHAGDGSPAPRPKYEPDQPGTSDYQGHGDPEDPYPAGLPVNDVPDELYSEKEREAIRNLLDVPAEEIPAGERQKQPFALNRQLLAHQRIGLTWLLKQEKSPHKGGILADGMGLGKTIQALALMLSNPPQDSTRKTTLIVVPTSLLRQWEREIDEKVKPGHKLKTVILHSMRKRNMTVAKLLSYDVVLTTYGTLAFEWKQVFENRKLDAGLLLASHARFHRIILDEAHNIKNRNSNASKAVDRLHGTYRLCMTGTPLMNRLDELYPLLRFLGVELYKNWDYFRKSLKAINRGSKRALTQLHVLLGHILLRRTENTMVDGAPVLALPELTIHTVEAVFDKDQLEYYQALEQHSQLRMNRFLKENTVMRHYWYILLLILRLRQCCCHPYLIKDHAIPEGVDMTPEDMNKLARKLTKPVVDRIRRQNTFECPMCHENTESPILIYPCGHHVCGDCITNMISIREPGLDFEHDEDSVTMGQCPVEGCMTRVDSKQFICHRYFSEVYPHSGGEGQHGSDISDEGDMDDEEADEQGNLKDFVVSDDHDSSDPEESGSGPRSDNDPRIEERIEPARLATGSDDDDSDDSLPPIDSFFSHIKKKTESSKDSPNTSIAGSQGARRNKNDQNGHTSGKNQASDTKTYSSSSTRDIAGAESGASSDRKRKMSLGKATATAKPKKKMKRGRKKRTELTLGAIKQMSSNSAAAKERYFNGLRKDWETSAKVDKAMELLGMIRRDFPDEKTLVFSQFTSFLDLMEIPVSDDGYNYRRYDGSMPNGDREQAVDDFMKKKEVKVMLVSLRCGNAGLNLYAATRVIMLDPFWNPAVEDQAIKRAHRLGQARPVVAYRILVKETVEDRILTLQEMKRQLVGDVLDPEARKGVGRLSMSEIAGLFGIRWPR